MDVIAVCFDQVIFSVVLVAAYFHLGVKCLYIFKILILNAFEF